MNNTVLFVDDEDNVLSAYQRNLRGKYKILVATSGYDGLKALKGPDQIAVIVSDFRMPQMDGVKFLTEARKISPNSVRMLLTGYADLQTAIDAINEGNIFRLLTKPATASQLTAAINAGVEQYRLVTAEKELVDKTLKGSIKILIDILSAVNPLAFSQAARYRNLAKLIAAKLQVEKVWEVEIASLLSQIGCVGVPSDILYKKYKGEQLNDSEKKLFQSHPQIGQAFLKNIPRLEDISDAIGHQLKSYNDELMPNESRISNNVMLLAGILKAVTDFDSLMKSEGSNQEAFNKMKKEPKHYYPGVLAALESELENLSNGFLLKSVSVDELAAGMILADDILDEERTIVISRGVEITDIIKVKLTNHNKVKKILEPVKVMHYEAK